MNAKKILCWLAGYVYIDPAGFESQAPKILHISDTPKRFFPALNRLIRQLEPTYIIHTGDLVDNIKLQLYPGSIHRYEQEVKALIDILESSGAKEIFLALGNHDNEALVKKFAKRSHIIETVQNIDIEGFDICISHYGSDILKTPGSLNFFGHDLSLETADIDGKLYFNGITDIHLIELHPLKIHYFEYPMGTNEDRLCKRRTSF